MKTSWMCLVVAFLSFVMGVHSSLAGVQHYQSQNMNVHEFNIDHLTFEKTEHEGFQRIKLVGVEDYAGVKFEVGAPELPVIRLFVTGQPKVVVSSSATLSTQLMQSDDGSIIPNQASLAKLPNQGKRIFRLNQSIYNQNTFLPGKHYDVKKAGSVRGVTRHLVTIYPVQYNPVTKQLKLIKSFKVMSARQEPKLNSAQELMTFIIGERFADSPSLQAYQNLKRSMGYTIRNLVITEENKDPEAIRAAIQEIYTSSEGALKYAIIIGDDEDVPGYNTRLVPGVTDHYYRAIDTDDYSTDINGPDIGLGRISITSEEELAGVLSKYTRYQQGNFADQNWLKGAAFLATNDRYTVAEASHNYAIENYTIDQGYKGFFPEENQLGGDKVYAITHRASYDDTQRVIQAGRTIINYSGHGGYTLWDSPRMTQDDVRSLDDPNSIPFVISNACITGNFQKPESFGETWQRHPFGAIMFWGSMGNTYWDEDDILEKRMYDGIYALKLLRFAEITQHALAELWKHYGGDGRSRYYWETYVTFGDPSVSLRTSHVKAINVEPQDTLIIGSDEATYTLTDDNGEPVSHARVALLNEMGELIQVAYSDAEGNARFADLAESMQNPQDLKVVVTGQNTSLKTHDHQVLAPNTPYLSIKNLNINEQNSKFVANAEHVYLNFDLKNVGGARASSAKVFLETDDPNIQIIGKSFTLGSTAPGSTYKIRKLLSFKVGKEAAFNQNLDLRIRVQTRQREFVKRMKLKVQGANLDLAEADFGGTYSNEGGINPGDEGEVFVTLNNKGSMSMQSASFKAEPVKCIDEIYNSIDVSELAAGESVRLPEPLQVKISANCEVGSTAEVKLVGTYRNGHGIIPINTTMSFIVGAVSNHASTHEDLEITIADKDITEFTFDINAEGPLTGVGLDIQLTHSYMYDLSIKLIHPDGTEVLIRKRTRGRGELDTSYGIGGEDIAELEQFKGKPAQGAWILKIQDHSTRDEGVLKKANLRLKGYFK